MPGIFFFFSDKDLTSEIVFCPFSSPGFEDGQKYAEKIVAKHKEVLESITELCVSLTELEEKLKVISSSQNMYFQVI